MFSLWFLNWCIKRKDVDYEDYFLGCVFFSLYATVELFIWFCLFNFMWGKI